MIDSFICHEDNLHFIFFNIVLTQASGKHEIKEVKSNNVEHLSYLATYILPFVGLKFDSWQSILATISLFYVLGHIYIKTNIILTNPTLTFFKYSISTVVDSKDKTKLIIHKGEIPKNKEIDLADFYYETTSTDQVVQENDTLEVAFILDLGAGRRISHKYGIANGTYQVNYHLNIEGFDEVLTANELVYHWNDRIKALEKDIEESRQKTTINYYLASGDFEDLKATSDEVEEETITQPIKWVAIKQKFFTSSIIANDPFTNGYVKTDVSEENEDIVKTAEVLLEIPLNETGSSDFTYYFGPNNYQILKKVTDGFSKNIYLGWPPLNLVNKFLIIPIFNFLEGAIGNYGIIS